MNSLQDLGRAVAELRQERAMTQRELAASAGLGTSTLARFETGGVAEFGSRKLLRLLEVLGCEMSFTPTQRGFTLDDALAERLAAVATAPDTPAAPPKHRRSAGA